MRLTAGLLFVCGLVLAASFTNAQPPDGGKGGKGGKGAKGDKGGGGPGGMGGFGGKSATVDEMVARMMTFDKNMDGKLTKEEVTDSRLQSLFDRADADKDGILTKEELTTFFTKEAAALGTQGGGFGGPPGGGFGGPGGGFGGPGGPPRIGQIMPPFIQDILELNESQKKQVADLQKEVDTKLEKILTDDQKKQLKDMRSMGPGGPGGPGGGNPPPKKD